MFAMFVAADPPPPSNAKNDPLPQLMRRHRLAFTSRKAIENLRDRSCITLYIRHRWKCHPKYEGRSIARAILKGTSNLHTWHLSAQNWWHFV